MTRTNHRSIVLFPAIAAVVLVFFLQVVETSADPVSKTGFYFDTVVTVSIQDAPDPEGLAKKCFDLMSELEGLFSRTLEGSDIWRINHAGGESVTVSPRTADLLRFGLSWAEQTDGALDITIAPVSSLWNFTDGSNTVPDEADLNAALSHVGYQNIVIEDSTVTLEDPEAMIDLGAIAKGYAADALRDFLAENGCTSALVNLGGNVLTVGRKPDNSAWNIGIRKPFGEPEEVIAVVPAADQCVITSGSYERCFRANGKLYHHILDPKTGVSADSGLNSVSILSASGSAGDALSTACFVMGLEKGMALIESLPGIEALFINEDNELIPSSGWPGSPL